MNNLRKIIREYIREMLQEEKNSPDAEKRLTSPDVNYFGPEKGPFKCGHCRFFDAARGFCVNKKVQAYTQAEGCCNQYLPKE